MITTDYLDVCAIDGRVFEITGTLTIPLSSTVKLLGTVSDIRTCLVNYFIRAEKGLVAIRLIEDVTVTDSGTPLSITNRNRNSDNTPNTLAFASPTVSGGTKIYESSVPDVGGGAHIQGGDSEMPSIFVLKDNANYVFEIQNTDTTDTIISYSILWCEEEK